MESENNLNTSPIISQKKFKSKTSALMTPQNIAVLLVVFTVFVIFLGKAFVTDKTSPAYHLSQMPTTLQVKTCEYALEDDDLETYIILYSFENIVRDNLSPDYVPAITYSDGVHEIDYSDASERSGDHDEIAANDIKLACQEAYDSDSEFSGTIDKLFAQKAEAQKQYERKKAEARAKIQPLLDVWNNKAIGEGGGDILEFLAASSEAENQIKMSSQYSLSGVSANISSVTCYPTSLSRWVGGSPGGWWSCLVMPLGGDYDLYSIQFENGSFGGKPDGGKMAGRDLNWKIPPRLLEWIRSN